MNRRTIYRLAALAGLLLALWIGRLALSGPRRSTILPDGREVELVAVTFGQEHRFAQGPVWLKLGSPFLPERWLGKLGLQVSHYKTANSCLVVWLRWSATNTLHAPGTDASLVAVDGTECEPVRATINLYPGRLQSVGGWEFPAFPRRGATIGVRVYDRDNAMNLRRLAEFSFRNPAPRKYPQWPVPILPARANNEHDQFQLLQLSPVVFPSRPGFGTIAPWTEARFEIISATERHYRVNGLSIDDATGNSITKPASALRLNEGPLNLCFNTVLWPGENAYRLSVEFVATNGFNSNEIYRTDFISLPPPGKTAPLGQQVPLQGVWLVLQALQHRVADGMLTAGATRDRAVLRATLSPPTEGLHLTLLEAIDREGHSYRHELTYARANGQHEFMIHLPPSAGALQLTLAVHPGSTLQFMIPPPR